jgi:2-aminoadipate transaminase
MTVAEPVPTSASAPLPPLAARARAIGGSPVRDILAVTARPEVINFAGGLPAPELFDQEGVAAAFRDVLAETPGRALQYSTTEGEPGLRAALAARMASRGLATDADDVLVTTGSQQALSLLATVLLEPGDTVLVESPCYLAALQAFGFAGARVVAVPGDGEGLDPEALEELVIRERPKLLYTVPTFQNPTGRTLPAERRAAVASVAARRGLWIIEDDPYGELRFEGPELPRMLELDTSDCVVYASSFSKTIAPGVRVGYLIGPPDLIAAVTRSAVNTYISPNMLSEAIVSEFCHSGAIDRSIATVKAALRERRDALAEGLRGYIGEEARFVLPEGGYFLWVELPEEVDTSELQTLAAERGVTFVVGRDFMIEGGTNALRLAYSAVTPEQADEGVRRLADALMALREGAPAA